jgi:hypothetical protein
LVRERIDAAPIAAAHLVISGGNNLILANAASTRSEARLELPALCGLSHGGGEDAAETGTRTWQTRSGVKKCFVKPLAPIVIPTVLVGFASVAKNHLELAVFNAISVWIMGAPNDALNLRRSVHTQDISMEPSFEPTILVYGNLSLTHRFWYWR